MEAAGQAQRRFLMDIRGLQGELSVVAQQIEACVPGADCVGRKEEGRRKEGRREKEGRKKGEGRMDKKNGEGRREKEERRKEKQRQRKNRKLTRRRLPRRKKREKCERTREYAFCALVRKCLFKSSFAHYSFLFSCVFSFLHRLQQYAAEAPTRAAETGTRKFLPMVGQRGEREKKERGGIKSKGKYVKDRGERAGKK